MSDKKSELPKIDFSSVQEKWDKIIQTYGQTDTFLNAFGRAYASNPFVQNDRLKQIKSQSSKYTREQIENMFLSMGNNEQGLRQASHYFNNTIAPINKLNNMYADILSYRNYINTLKINNSNNLMIEYEKLANKKTALDIPRTFRDITYQSIIEGKRFYYFREEGDSVCFQPMPSDYMKIVHRYEGGWQCAINMMYFMRAGVSVDYFAPEFEDYVAEFFNVYDKDTGQISLEAQNLKDVEIYNVGNNYYFWKFLPIDKCFAFGLNDCEPEVVPTLASMFLDANELSSYKMLEQELLSIPLKSIMTATVPMNKEAKGGNFNNATAITPDLVQLYQSIIQSVLPSSVDAIVAPLENFMVHTFDSVSSKDSIVGNAMMNFYNQSAVSGIISTTSKPNVSQVKTTQIIESAYVDKIYHQYNYFFRQWIKRMNLKNSFEIIVEGDRFRDDDKLASIEKGLTTGNKNLYPQYLSFFKQDLTTAKGNMETVDVFGIYGLMQSLVSSFQSKGEESTSGRPQKNPEDMKNDVDNGSNIGRETFVKNFASKLTEEQIELLVNELQNMGIEVGEKIE